MTVASFNKKEFLDQKISTLTHSQEVTSLWFDGHGEWQKAHDLVDGLSTPNAERIHAYLHRKEGDQWNAQYWYRRAGVIMPTYSLDQEWTELCQAII